MTAGDTRATLGTLSLRNFRNIAQLELEIPDAGLALVGDNGQGKTNLLEAIYYLSLFRSVRGTRDVDLVRFGEEGFFVEGVVSTPTPHTVSIGFDRASRRKRVRLDSGPPARLSDALGTLPVVMFAPTDVELLIGGPVGRRRFLDIMLAVTAPGYLDALQRYRAALMRRNAALRSAARRDDAASGVSVWDAPLAEHGARIIRARREWIVTAAEPFARRMEEIGEPGTCELRYLCRTPPDAGSEEQALLGALHARLASDIRFGATHAGPHRDDLLILLDGRDVRTFGSAGQQRSAAIALRSVEADTLRVARGQSPVFLLDDPFAELDADRAARVLALLQHAGAHQTFLAVPRESDVPDRLTTLPRRRIVRGTVR